MESIPIPKRKTERTKLKNDILDNIFKNIV